MNLVRATRQAIEQRMDIQDFDAVLDMMAGGGAPSYTGKSVSPQSALGVSACWACVNVLADDVAALPFLTYRWQTPGVSRDEARDHYLWPLLYEEANPRMSAYDFKQVMETWRNLWGNAYAEVEMNGRGQVTALWPWRPDRVKVWLENPNDVRSQVFYSYIPPDRTKPPITLPSDNILHIRHTSIDGIMGLSPIEVHRQKLGLDMAMQEYSGRFYSNGAVVLGALKHPGTLSGKAEASLRESMKQYQGLANSHRMMILEQGMEYVDIGIKQEDAQYIESMNFNGQDICRIYKVPPHKAGFLDRATFSNIEHQSMDYVQGTLIPIMANWGGRIHCSLLSVKERQAIFVEPDFTRLLMGDHDARAKYYVAMANVGALAPDEIRQGEGYNPLANGMGKYPRAPLNTVPMNKADQPAEVVAPSNAPPNGNKKPNGVGALHQ